MGRPTKSPEEMFARVSLTLPSETFRLAKEKCKETNTPFSTFVSECIQYRLQRRDPRLDKVIEVVEELRTILR